jgi:hypothetical protein
MRRAPQDPSVLSRAKMSSISMPKRAASQYSKITVLSLHIRPVLVEMRDGNAQYFQPSASMNCVFAIAYVFEREPGPGV